MSIGSKWEVVIPPEQAFGERGYEFIEPNETIIFEIELLDIQRELNP
jgi:FKBP-type peptidyl-prolyl cis-trans isomerase FklB